MSTIHIFLTYFPNIHFNIILPSTLLGLQRGLLPSDFLTKILYAFLIPPMREIPHPSHSPWFDHPNNIWWSIQVMKLLIMQSPPASSHFLPLRPKYKLWNSLWKTLKEWKCWRYLSLTQHALTRRNSRKSQWLMPVLPVVSLHYYY
jgi:hypothetical protein